MTRFQLVQVCSALSLLGASTVHAAEVSDLVCLPPPEGKLVERPAVGEKVFPIHQGRYKGMIGYTATSSPTVMGAVPYRLCYSLIVGKQGEQIGPDSFLQPREGLSGVGLCGPTGANWYGNSCFDLLLNGHSLGEGRGRVEQRRFADRDETTFHWRTPEGEVRLTFAVAKGDDRVRVSGEVKPAEAVYELVVKLRCYPGGFREPRARRVSTARRQFSAPANFALAADEFWALYWDEEMDRARAPERSQGCCALMVLPEEGALTRVSVTDYPIDTTITYPAGTRRFHLALWEFPGFSAADALAYMRELTQGVIPALGRAAPVPVLTEKTAPGDLVVEGRPAASIVVPAEPSELEVTAARELQTYLAKMSGAILPIVRDDQPVAGNRLLVGKTRFTDRRRLGITGADPGYEGFVLKSVGRDILVTGADEYGTQYAAYALLERLGVRWFVPAPLGEVVPERKNVRLTNLNVRERPDFPLRWVGSGEWATRNRGNRSTGAFKIEPSIYHSQRHLMPLEIYYQDHPEYFALVKGKRGGDPSVIKQCVSNPEVAWETARRLAEIAAQDPRVKLVSLSPTDGMMYCECERCRALDEKDVQSDQRMSRRLLLFYNRVAEGLERLNPKAHMLVGAYHIYARPPRDRSIRAHRGLTVIICHYNEYCLAHSIADSNCEKNARYRELVRAWQDIGCRVCFYEYYVKGEWLSMFWPITRSIAGDMPWYKSIGALGVYSQYNPARAWTLGLQYYVAARLLWDCDQSVDALLDDFCHGLFGKAGPLMRQFYEAMDEAMATCGRCISGQGWVNGPVVFTPELCARLNDLLARAQAAAQGDLVRRRLKKVEGALYFTTRLVDFLRRYQAAPKLTEAAARVRAFEEAGKSLQSLLEEVRADPDRFRHSVSPVYHYMNRYLERCRQMAEFSRVVDLPKVADVPRRWRFKTDPKDEGLKGRWFAPEFDDSEWEEIEIARTWEEQGYDYDGFAWYRVRLDLPEAITKKKLLLLFEAVDGEAWVYFNGEQIAHHVGWDEPFVAPLPEGRVLHKGNVLAVRVWDGSAQGGIWRPVSLREKS
ncbi:MAG TPA: DUF4838 domain-containing protein [Armatimonadetes bacterium]|nr:DUF4838 domain-containing protein [Armatimonadota bacterium]